MKVYFRWEYGIVFMLINHNMNILVARKNLIQFMRIGKRLGIEFECVGNINSKHYKQLIKFL